MPATALAWLIAALAGAAALALLAALRTRMGAVAELELELEQARNEVEGLRKRKSKDVARKDRKGEELNELRRKLDKARKRAALAKDELGPAHERVRELEAQLLRRDDELRALRSERQVAPPVPVPVPVSAPEPTPVAEVALKQSEDRAARAEARVDELTRAAEQSERDLERQRVRIRNQDTLYTSQRLELEVKNDQIKQQREQLERLSALRVAWGARSEEEETNEA